MVRLIIAYTIVPSLLPIVLILVTRFPADFRMSDIIIYFIMYGINAFTAFNCVQLAYRTGRTSLAHFCRMGGLIGLSIGLIVVVGAGACFLSLSPHVPSFLLKDMGILLIGIPLYAILCAFMFWVIGVRRNPCCNS